MMDEAVTHPWRSQSAVTQLALAGAANKAIDALPGDLAALRAVSQQLVAHYAGSSDGTSGPVEGERLHEVDTRYADAMFARLLTLGSPTLSRPRTPEERIVGCCRDFAVLFVTMARHHGHPARVRVGYATYFRAEWYLDHVIAEVWDSAQRHWRLIEPEIGDQFVPAGEAFDPLDVPPERFVTGPRAWLAARAGQIDPERFVVAPDLDEPYTRGWLSLRHHLVQDLAALNKAEMLVWDQWGILDEEDPLRHAEMLDQLARVTSQPNYSPAEVARWSRQEGLAVPSKVTSYSPAHVAPLIVDVDPVLAGMLEP